MARLKFPGSKRCAPSVKTRANTGIQEARKENPAQRNEDTGIRPQVISRRRYREIFGDSDEEVLLILVTVLLWEIRYIVM